MLSIQQPIPAYVNPFDVELHLNPVYYPSRAGPSKRPDKDLDQTPYPPDSDRQRDYSLIPLPLRSGTSDMEMSSIATSANADELHVREPTPNSNKTSIDVEQGATAWPLRDTRNQVDPEIQRQTDHSKTTDEHDKMDIDTTSSSSPTPRIAGPSRAFSPPPASNLAPRKRVAVLDLHPLETGSGKAELRNDQSKSQDDRLSQKRRAKQRTLMPKSSSPQSSKSTPGSAKTESSFASTATNTTQATSPGSAITTPSIATASPASSRNATENNLECQTCGQLFSTAGRQKYVFPPMSQDSFHVCDTNLVYTQFQSISNITITKTHTNPISLQETLQPHTPSPLRVRHLRTAVRRKSRSRAPRAHRARRVFPLSQAFLVHCSRVSNAEQGMEAQRQFH